MRAGRASDDSGGASGSKAKRFRDQADNEGTWRGQHACEISQMRQRAFSLVELVIVVVIIGIIAAIAVPRMSRAAKVNRMWRILGVWRRIRDKVEHIGVRIIHRSFIVPDDKNFAVLTTTPPLGRCLPSSMPPPPARTMNLERVMHF